MKTAQDLLQEGLDLFAGGKRWGQGAFIRVRGPVDAPSVRKPLPNDLLDQCELCALGGIYQSAARAFGGARFDELTDAEAREFRKALETLSHCATAMGGHGPGTDAIIYLNDRIASDFSSIEMLYTCAIKRTSV